MTRQSKSQPSQTTNKNFETREEQRNEDPLSGESGAHPVGAGIGAALGGLMAGAAAGSLGGPIGTIVGAVAGGVAGGLGGKALAENMDPTIEMDYWRDNYNQRPYYDPDYSFDRMAPAYRTGVDHYEPGVRFEDREPQLRQHWETTNDVDTITWDKARHAAKDAWDRIDTTARPFEQSAPNKPR